MRSEGGEIAGWGGQPVTQLIGVARDSAHLVRQELNLARQETIEKLTPAARSTGLMLGGGVLAAWGVSYLLQAAVRALSTRMPPWLASLVFGGFLTAGGIALLGLGRRQLASLSLVPHKTINSLKENKEWALHQIRSKLI